MGVIRIKKAEGEKQEEYETWTKEGKDLVYRTREIAHLADSKNVAIVGTRNDKVARYVYENFVLPMEDILEELDRKARMLKVAETGLSVLTISWNLDEVDKKKRGSSISLVI